MPPFAAAGSVRDRTAEFTSLADRLRREQVRERSSDGAAGKCKQRVDAEARLISLAGLC